jgi:hypothetical protein
VVSHIDSVYTSRTNRQPEDSFISPFVETIVVASGQSLSKNGLLKSKGASLSVQSRPVTKMLKQIFKLNKAEDSFS